MTEQLTFTTLGGETVTVKKRGKHYVEPRGYAAPPGTGPAGETCKTCKHYTHRHWGGTYRKCMLNRAKWTRGPGTDIRAGSPACSKWEAEPETAV